MTREEQKDFLKNCIDRTHAEMLEAFEHNQVPEEWNGVELQQWLADKFNHTCSFRNLNKSHSFSNARDKRRRAYENNIRTKPRLI